MFARSSTKTLLALCRISFFLSRSEKVKSLFFGGFHRRNLYWMSAGISEERQSVSRLNDTSDVTPPPYDF